MKYYFDKTSAHRAVAFIEKHIQHCKGELAGKPFLLEKWQKEKIIEPLFGWKREDGTRKYRTAYIEIPRKNGKSSLCAAIALYMLYADGELGAEVISAAADRSQAGIVFEIAKAMVLGNKELSKRGKVFRNSVTLEHKNSYYKAISADANTKHGFNCSAIIFDELHAQKTRELFDVLTTSTGARRQPLTICITTAGYDKESICYEVHTYAQQVLSGAIKDESFLPVIFAAGKDDDWTKKSTWKKANPAYGSIIKDEYFAQQFNKANQIASYENTFKRLHLNIWTTNESKWINDEVWNDCNLGEINVEDFKGRDCFGGLDLASTRDLTALTLVFPNDDGTFEVLPFFFVPESKVYEKKDSDGVDYLAWVNKGFMYMTEGNVVDYNFIQEKIYEICEMFNVVGIGFDRWNSSQLVINLTEEGVKMNPIGQGFASMSAPCKELEKLVYGKQINHGNHPVLNWNASNVQIQADAAGNIKFSKAKSKSKIDGMVALVMALAQYMNQEEEDSGSVYQDKDILFI
tara:strand:- start:249 stop:1802 length:1554 start_codon:yes stop_codon:yes gene_type:complete